MPVTTRLTMSLIAEALAAESIKHEIDDDGDVRLTFTREKGKDLIFYLFDPDKTSGVLSMACMVRRWFRAAQVAELMVFCNTWNREHRLPKSYVTGPDSDNDYAVSLNHTVICESGIHRELIQENLSLFIIASGDFWDSLDTAI